MLKALKLGCLTAIGILILIVIAAKSCSNDGGSKSSLSAEAPSSLGAPSASGPKFDLLDVLPASVGDLRVTAAWRVAGSGAATIIIGKYRWQDGSAAVAELSCNFPPSEKAECDSSTPLKLKFGNVKACAAIDDDRASQSGPMIAWPSCFVSLNYGQGGRRRFEQLKKAVADAVPWTQMMLAATEATADAQAIKRNRDDGLLAASQRGNDQVPGLSHQLDDR